jgi:hypothetical protein
VYCKELSRYGAEIKMKNNLQVNVFNGQPRIWLKPWWQKADCPDDTIWLPSNAGFQFSIHDIARDLVAFANKHMENVASQYRSAKAAVSAAASAAAAAAAASGTSTEPAPLKVARTLKRPSSSTPLTPPSLAKVPRTN